MKANKPISQSSKPKPDPTPEKVEVPEEIKDAKDDYLDEEDEVEEDKVEEVKVEEVKEVEEKPVEKVDAEQQIMMEIELLQNNGRYRVELLHQLQEINKALIVVAGVLVDLAGKDGKE